MRKSIYLVFSTTLLFLSGIVHAQKAIEIGKESNRTGEVLIIGKVMDFETGETLIGATVIVDELKKGEITDINGMFGIYVPIGEYTLSISSVGYQALKQPIIVNGTGEFKIRLLESVTELAEVLIQSEEEDVNVRSTDLGKNTLSMESIERLPPFAGEVDILKSITLLPGVTSVGEASSGFNVRGGGTDQNLILLGGAVLYNPSHLFGFFSSFNSDLVRNVTIYKGGIPAKYGGRASSILDLEYRKGDKKRWRVKGSLGLVSLKLAVEGPIVKDKLSVLMGARTSYSNWLLRAVNDADIKNSSTQFYDLNGLVNYQLNDNNDLNYSFYRSYDDFKFASDTSNAWTNMAHVFDWKHAFSDRTILQTTLARSEYKFSIINKVGFNSFTIDSEVIDQGASLGLEFGLGNSGTGSVGVQFKQIAIDPGSLSPFAEGSGINPQEVQTEQAFEGGAYLQHDFEIGKLGVSYGLRYNRFWYMGDRIVNSYEINQPRTEETIVNQTQYGSGDVIADYDGFEPRLSLRWSINTNTSVKVGYNRMFQYVHLISNTTTISPTDIWKLSDQFVKPEIGSQISLGVFKNFSNNTIETSIEGYYKTIENIVEYKDGAQLILNEHIETELLTGDARTWGVELYAKKTFGRLEGWASYTYSRSLREVKGPYPEETINLGEEYPSNFDKPHDLTAVIDYSINDNVKFSSIFTYSTGRAVTTPSAKFSHAGTNVSFFDKRNNNRAPDYHRLDVSLTFKFDSRRKLLNGDWVFSIYNLYGRKNAFSVFFDDVDGAPPQAYKMSVLGIPFPTLSYNFEF